MSVFPLKDLVEYGIIDDNQYSKILKMYAGQELKVPKKEFNLSEIKKCYDEMKMQDTQRTIIFKKVSQITGKSIRTLQRYKQNGVLDEN